MAVLKYYNTATSAWEYIAASTTANFTSWKKTMAGGETSVSGTDDNSVTLSYTVGLEQVFINGVLQVRGTDYVATNGTSVTGLSVLAASDVVTVVCYAPFNVANTIAPTVVDAKGDLLAGTAADTVGRLAVSASNTAFLRADSGETTGLKWDNDAWTSYTPTISGGSVGNGTLDAKYKQIGKTIFVRFKFTLGSTSSVNGFQITKPVTSVAVPSVGPLAPAGLRDSGVAGYLGMVAEYDTTKFYVTNVKTDTTYAGLPEIGTTTPFTWSTSDEIAFTCVYEAA